MKKFSLSFTVTTLLLAGCTAKDGYYLLQDLGEGQARCEEYPDYDDYQACLSRFRQSYEDYRREREELLKGSIPKK